MANTRVISFHFNAPEARSVSIVGDFNSWSLNAKQLRRRKDGVWWAVLRLSPGVYQYKFVVDGARWEEDPGNPKQVTNEHGTHNSVCEVR
jgi:1,4-alpha-glucan branching enzyme